jgi:hypothetical protein
VGRGRVSIALLPPLFLYLDSGGVVMAPGDVLALVFSVLNSLGLMTVIQVVAVILAAVAVARYFLSRS